MPTRAEPAARASTGHPAALDFLLLAVGVLGVSTSGPLIAVTVAPALAIAFWRNAMSLGALAPLALVRNRGELRALDRGTWAWSGGAGSLLGVHFALWVPSLTLTTVASATALVCMQAVWTAVFARLAGHAVSRRAWAGMALALVGVLAVTGVDFALEPRALVGDVMALAAGVFSGAYVVVGSHVRRNVSTTSYTTICYGAAAALLLALCLVAGTSLTGYAGADWAKIVALTVTAQLLGHSVFNHVVRRVGPTVVSLSVLLEVPGAALLAALFIGQVPSAGTLPGMALVVAGIALVITAPQSEPQPVVVPVE